MSDEIGIDINKCSEKCVGYGTINCMDCCDELRDRIVVEKRIVKDILEKIDSLIEIQQGSLSDKYMLGLYNGLICAKSVITGEEPKYIEL